MARRHPSGLDPLECRRCLTIVAEVDSGDLFFSGDAGMFAGFFRVVWGRFFAFGRGFGR